MNAHIRDIVHKLRIRLSNNLCACCRLSGIHYIVQTYCSLERMIGSKAWTQVNIKRLTSSSSYLESKMGNSQLLFPRINLCCMQGCLYVAWILKPFLTLKHYHTVAGDRMMNSWLCSRIQDQSRGKLLTGEGVPRQCTMNEQVRGVKNRVSIELGVLKDGLGNQLSVIHFHSEHLRVQPNLRLLQTFMALFFIDYRSVISLPSWRPNKAKYLAAYKELFRSLKYNCDNQK